MQTRSLCSYIKAIILTTALLAIVLLPAESVFASGVYPPGWQGPVPPWFERNIPPRLTEEEREELRQEQDEELTGDIDADLPEPGLEAPERPLPPTREELEEMMEKNLPPQLDDDAKDDKTESGKAETEDVTLPGPGKDEMLNQVPVMESPHGSVYMGRGNSLSLYVQEEAFVQNGHLPPAQSITERLTLFNPTGEKVNEKNILIEAAGLKRAAAGGQALELDVEDARLFIAPTSVKVLSQKGALYFTVSRTEVADASQPNLQKLSDPLKVELFTIDDQNTLAPAPRNLDEAFVLKFQIPDHLSAQQQRLLGVYKQDPTTAEWQYAGGIISDEENIISTEQWQFSTFCLASYHVQFSDMADHWAQEDVEIMAARHLVRGVSVNHFAPQRPVTRAEFATLLVRVLDIAGEGDKDKYFSDVGSGDWFKKDVYTAADSGLIEGYADGTFRPGKEITRQEMGVMLGKAMELRHKLPQGDKTEALLHFNDKAELAVWAEDGVALSVLAGLIQGRSESRLAPAASATRAEAVVILKNLLGFLGEL